MTRMDTRMDVVARAMSQPGCCVSCGIETWERDAAHLCVECATLTEAPKVRLGKHERAIVLACFHRAPRPHDHWSSPDCYSDELLGVIAGLQGHRIRMRSHRGPSYYLREVPPTRYDWRSAAQRNRVQATLSRAIRTLYAKGLIDCGGVYEAAGHGTERQRTYIKSIRLTNAGKLVAAKLDETLRVVG